MTKSFSQESPNLTNQYIEDKLLISYVKRFCKPELLKEVEKDLSNLGNRVVTDILEMAIDAESNLPQLIQFDAWGNRIDQIKVSKGWKDLESVSAQEGMIATGYERKYGDFSRVYQFIKLYLFNPSSALFTCPLAMTDGAAKLIEVHGDEFLKKEIYSHIISRDPKLFWTSGQWMTEKTGGSDVGRSETIAKYENGVYKLYGTKWFTSATTSQIAFTLARIEDEKGNSIQGSRGLSLFFVKVHKDDGSLNNIEIHRLKDKLGTKALPTAELTLNGTEARLVGEIGKGVKNISALFNVTRIYNSNTSVAFIRRALALIKDYSKKRFAFGKYLIDHPLHIQTLSDLEIEFQSAFHTMFYTVSLLGKEECNTASKEEILTLRLLTPLIKLYTGKQAVGVASEVLELFGGAGYVEDTGLPKLLRDSQVLAIWEGTTNILSLDVLRSIFKEGTLEPFIKNIENRINIISLLELNSSKEKVKSELNNLKVFIKENLSQKQDFIETTARIFSYSLFRLFSASLMLEHADYTKDESFILSANRWCQKSLFSFINADEKYREENLKIIL
jgi:putative acyl-CoA dehydrogenase